MDVDMDMARFMRTLRVLSGCTIVQPIMPPIPAVAKFTSTDSVEFVPEPLLELELELGDDGEGERVVVAIAGAES